MRAYAVQVHSNLRGANTMKWLIAAMLGFLTFALRWGVEFGVAHALGHLQLEKIEVECGIATLVAFLAMASGVMGGVAGAAFVAVRKRFRDMNVVQAGALYFVCLDLTMYALSGFKARSAEHWVVGLLLAVFFGALFGLLYGFAEKRLSASEKHEIPGSRLM